MSRDSDIADAQLALLSAARDCLKTAFPEAYAFLPEPWQRDEPSAWQAAYQTEPACPLSMLEELEACLRLASPATRPLVALLVAQRQKLRWQQSYSSVQGFDRHYLEHYGWINLISPDGPFVDQALRLTIGYWGAGLHYPQHQHAPEEIYCILAGQAVFHSSGQPPRLVGPGDWVHHQSLQPHGIHMTPGPLLALVPWRGTGLTAISSFDVQAED